MSRSTPEPKAKSRFEQRWHYRPEKAIATSPLFAWPPKPLSLARWFMARWLRFGENLLLVGLACLTWFFFHPSLEQSRTLSFDWIAMIFAQNFLLVTLVAGTLHLCLHVKKTQGKKLKFDPKDINAKGTRFTMGSQLKDNIFWTLSSGVFFWSAYEVLMFWAMANAFSPLLWWAQSPLWFCALFLLTPIWISLHFYWIHRFLHWPPLYRAAHALHHRNTNVGPWSGLSMHPIEHALFFSSILIHWIVAAHPIHILFHMQHQALTAVTSHAGFEALLVKNKRSLDLGNFHHQMHHAYFDCNYGNLEVPWDKAFGSFHDGTEESHAKFTKRRQILTAKA